MRLNGRQFYCGASRCDAGPFTVEEVAAHVLDCPHNQADSLVETAICRSMKEVRGDVGRAVNSQGVTMPAVTSFSELHDYVDANEYGGLCEDDLFDKVRDLEEATGRNLVDEIQCAVDRWIKQGALL